MKIAVFYHIFQYGPWQEIFNEQWQSICDSNLLHVADFLHFGVNGGMMGESGNPHIFVKLNPNPEMEESDTLLDLYNFAQDHEDYKILYIHTKGVSRYDKNVADWRRMMDFFCIDQWRKCVKLLDSCDAVGCNLTKIGSDEEPFMHFSGNFWWANASYIKTLDKSYLSSPNRFMKEFFIGSGKGNLVSIHDSGLDHYNEPYPPEKYQKDI